MASGDKTNPRVYLFKDDCDMILELVRRRPTRSTGGDLFGLWTNDREPVLHIVTGQGRETVSSPQEVFSSNNASNDSRIKDLGARLRDKYRLSYLGKWQYMPRSEPTEAEIIETVDQNTLFKGTGMKYFLLILASCDDQSSKVELNPYFLSRFSTTTRGEIADVLPSSSTFKEDDDIASIIDSLIDRGSFWEDNINRAGSATKQRVEGNRKETEALDQRESYENQTSDKITSKSPETFRKNSDPYLKLYMFHDHLQMIRDIVGCHPDAEAGGYLYGLWTNDGEPVLHRVTNNKNSATEIEISSEARYLECVGRWKYMSVCENIRSEMKSPQPDKRNSVFLMLEREEDQFMPSAFFLSDKSSFPTKMEIEVLDRIGAMKGEKFTDKDNRCEDTDHGERQPCCDLAVPEFNRFETGFACNPRELKVYLFQEDFEMMKDLVLRYPNVETGGDLFGLWTSDGDAVLHMVLGPGKNCKRTATSFYQDIPYLQEKGELLTTKYMLCHIGEWHSHHQLHLYEPSHGDSSTVIRHYPHGTCGFLLIIANILSPDTVLLSPYLYTARSQYDFYQKGQLVPLPSRNAFKKATEIARTISEGQETWSNFQSGMIQYSHYNRLPQMPRTSDQFNARGISEGRGQGSNFQSGMAQYSQHPPLPQTAEASSQSTESRMESSNDNNDELMELD